MQNGKLQILSMRLDLLVTINMEMFQREHYHHLIQELLLIVLLLITQIVTGQKEQVQLLCGVDLLVIHQLHIMMVKQIMDILSE